MRRLISALAILVSASACSNSSGPVTTPPRATLNFVVQDSTYKPILAAQGSFYAKVGEHREVRLVYQRSEEHTSELQSQSNLVCRLLLEKKKKKKDIPHHNAYNHVPNNATQLRTL